MNPDKTKILYVIGSLRRGGAERQVTELLKGLPAECYEKSLCLLSGGGEFQREIEDCGIPIIALGCVAAGSKWNPVTIGRFARGLVRLIRCIRKEKPQIVHGFLYWANLYAVLGARFAKPRRPILITSRRSLGLYKDDKPWMQRIENWMNRRTDAIVVNSKGVLHDCLRRESLRKEQLRLIYNGVDLTPFDAPFDAAKKRKELGVAESARVIVCVANLILYKGHEELISAMAQVVKEFPDAVLLLVGRDGGMERALKDQVAREGIGRSVVFLGSRGDAPDVIRAADILVLASHEEGFSNVLLEGMAAGKPMVATNVGGNPESVKDGVTGLLVPPRDSRAMAAALGALLRDPKRRETMGASGRQRVEEEFSLGKMIENYDRLYRELLAGLIKD
ncbi:MAG: glycosyltransferase [bacterium]